MYIRSYCYLYLLYNYDSWKDNQSEYIEINRDSIYEKCNYNQSYSWSDLKRSLNRCCKFIKLMHEGKVNIVQKKSGFYSIEEINS